MPRTASASPLGEGEEGSRKEGDPSEGEVRAERSEW